ncbi:hypothetical protein ACFLWZ_07985 [Chloroflexota bacterium]
MSYDIMEFIIPTTKSMLKSWLNMALWHLVISLAIAIFLCILSHSLALAQDLKESFQLDFDPVCFDKMEIHEDEIFHATITGRLTCSVDLPMSVSEAYLTYRVIAVNTTNNMWATLSENYTITMKPVPTKKGETAEIHQLVPLQFLAKPTPGEYKVMGKIIEAKAKVMFGWVNITSFLPQEQPMGTVQYVAPELTETSQPMRSETPSPSTSIPLTPTEPITVSDPTTSLNIIPWWVWLMVSLAAAITVANVVWFLRHRTR